MIFPIYPNIVDVVADVKVGVEKALTLALLETADGNGLTKELS